MIIIGITGTLGAGKGTIVDYLIEKRQFRHFSVRSYLIEEAEKQGLPINRDTFVLVANTLRSTHSPSYIIDQLFERAQKAGQNAIIESIRTPGEVDSLRQKGNFTLLAVDADPKVRYERIVGRNSETDHVSYETFIANEQREMTSTDPNKQNLSKCIAMADYTLQNNGDFEALYRQIDDIIKEIDHERD